MGLLGLSCLLLGKCTRILIFSSLGFRSNACLFRLVSQSLGLIRGSYCLSFRVIGLDARQLLLLSVLLSLGGQLLGLVPRELVCLSRILSQLLRCICLFSGFDGLVECDKGVHELLLGLLFGSKNLFRVGACTGQKSLSFGPSCLLQFKLSLSSLTSSFLCC